MDQKRRQENHLKEKCSVSRAMKQANIWPLKFVVLLGKDVKVPDIIRKIHSNGGIVIDDPKTEPKQGEEVFCIINSKKWYGYKHDFLDTEYLEKII